MIISLRSAHRRGSFDMDPLRAPASRLLADAAGVVATTPLPSAAAPAGAADAAGATAILCFRDAATSRPRGRGGARCAAGARGGGGARGVDRRDQVPLHPLRDARRRRARRSTEATAAGGGQRGAAGRDGSRRPTTAAPRSSPSEGRWRQQWITSGCTRRCAPTRADAAGGGRAPRDCSIRGVGMARARWRGRGRGDGGARQRARRRDARRRLRRRRRAW